MKLPELIVFDLDYTLWDCGGTWCDCLTPPFSQTLSGPADRYGRVVTLYDDIPAILEWCSENEVTMALASRTETPDWARKLLYMLKIIDLFKYQEIFPSSKKVHFSNLRANTDLEYKDILFYDDEMRNIREVGELGVTAVYVENGLNLKLFKEGLRKWQNSTSR